MGLFGGRNGGANAPDPMQPNPAEIEKYRHPEMIGAHYEQSKGVILFHLKFPLEIDIAKIALPEDLIGMLAIGWIQARQHEKQMAMQAASQSDGRARIVRPT